MSLNCAQAEFQVKHFSNESHCTSYFTVQHICLMIATEDNAERLPGLYVLFLSFGFTNRIEQIYGFNRILFDIKVVFLVSTATAGA